MIVVCVAAVLAIGGRSPAAEEKPSATEKADHKASDTQPTTRPQAKDAADVRAVLKSLAKALQDGNAEGIKHVIYASNPAETRMVDAMAAMSTQIAKLYKTSLKAFGEEEARNLIGDVAAEMTRIEKAEISIDGETATVRYPQDAPAAKSTTTSADAPDAAAAAADEGDDASSAPADGVPMVLKRVQGRWQVPMSELSKDTSPEEIEQRLADVKSHTKVIAELSGEIAEGKYKSADKAAEAWQAKMMQALVPRKPEGEKKG
jgi:hypothetical protein